VLFPGASPQPFYQRRSEDAINAAITRSILCDRSACLPFASRYRPMRLISLPTRTRHPSTCTPKAYL
jgi:hypothetical protein